MYTFCLLGDLLRKNLFEFLNEECMLVEVFKTSADDCFQSYTFMSSLSMTDKDFIIIIRASPPDVTEFNIFLNFLLLTLSDTDTDTIRWQKRVANNWKQNV